MKKYSFGFTMIELVVVIVILAILGGIALPRFINQTKNARRAAMMGANGAVASAVALAQAEYQAEGNSSTSTTTSVTMNGQAVTVISGSGRPIAAAAGLGNSLQSLVGYTITTTSPDTAQVDFFPTTIANCNVQYNDLTGIITGTSTGC